MNWLQKLFGVEQTAKEWAVEKDIKQLQVKYKELKKIPNPDVADLDALRWIGEELNKEKNK